MSSDTDSSDDIEADDDKVPQLSTESVSHGYEIRSRSTLALPDTVSTSDELSVKAALSSSEERLWVIASKKAFTTLKHAHTWEECPELPQRALPSGFNLRVKRDERGRPT